MDEKKEKTNFEINQVINQPYKYGFQTNIEMYDLYSIIPWIGFYNVEIISIKTKFNFGMSVNFPLSLVSKLKQNVEQKCWKRRQK